MFLDRVKYTSTKLTEETYNVSVANGYVAAPDNTLFTAVISEVTTPTVYLICSGTVASNVFTVKEIFSSSNGGAIPNFSGNLTITGTICKGILDRKFRGRAGILGIGQSNMVSWNTGNDARDFVYSNVLQWDTANGYTKSTVEPLDHITTSSGGAGTVSYLPAFGKRLVDEGYNTVVLIPRGANSSGFSSNNWNQGNNYYTSAVNAAIAFLNEDPLNYLECIILRMGETDNGAGWLAVQYRDAVVTMVNNMRTDIGAGSGRDLSKVPFICVGLNNDYINGPNYTGKIGIGVETGMEDVPNYLTYSSYLSLQTWSTATDTTHDTATTARRVGYKELYPALLAAKANHSPSQVSTVLTGSASVSVSTTGALYGEALLAASSSVSVSTTGLIGVPSLLAASSSVSVSTTGAVFMPVSTPNTDALAPTGHYRYDQGLNGTGPNYTSWDDLSGNANHLPAAFVGTPQITGSGLAFNTNSGIKIPASFFTHASGSSCVIKYTGTTGHIINHLNSFINLGGESVLWQTTGLNNSITTGLGDINDGLEHVIAVTLSTSALTVYLDGTQIGQDTSITMYTGSDGDGAIGCARTGSAFSDAVIKGLVFKRGVTWNLTEINQIAAEMPT